MSWFNGVFADVAEEEGDEEVFLVVVEYCGGWLVFGEGDFESAVAADEGGWLLWCFLSDVSLAGGDEDEKGWKDEE